MLIRVQIEHELRQRPLQPRQLALEHHETRAGHARRRLEIHQAERLAEFKMLFRLEIQRRLFADLADFDIVVLIRARRHVRQRTVGNRGEFLLQRQNRRLFLSLDGAHADFQVGDFLLELFGER